jgi:hypothetical protein
MPLIFPRSRARFGSALALNISVASRIHWIPFGDPRHRRRNGTGRASVSLMRAFRPPPTHRGRGNG